MVTCLLNKQQNLSHGMMLWHPLLFSINSSNIHQRIPHCLLSFQVIFTNTVDGSVNLTAHQVILLQSFCLWTRCDDALIHYFLTWKKVRDLWLSTVTHLFEHFFFQCSNAEWLVSSHPLNNGVIRFPSCGQSTEIVTSLHQWAALCEGCFC